MAIASLASDVIIMSRQEAKKNGIKVYFSGEPCRNGHICFSHIKNGCFECKKARNSSWRLLHRDAAISASKAWRDANPEKASSLVLAWHAKNKDKRRTHKHNRRARKIKNGGSLSKNIVAKIFKLQRGKCACCNSPLGIDYHLDHIIPLALGGTNSDDNVQLLTQRCNHQKGIKHPIEFMQQRGFLL